MVIAVVGIAPGFVDFLAFRLGVNYPPLLAVLGGMAVILFKLLKSDIERSRDQQQIRLLAQKVVVLEAELQSRRQERQHEPEPTTDKLRSAS